MRPILHRLAMAAALLLAGTVHAQTVLLNDSFDLENDGQGAGVYSGFANFVAADVDLLGPGYFFHLCQSAQGSTPCVDMQGNGNGTLTTRSAYALAPGRVTLQFDLAGDQRGSSHKQVTTHLFDLAGNTLFSETFSLAPDAAFATIVRTVDLTAPVSAQLQFTSSGQADSYGLLLDNVSLSVSAVPEGSPALLLATGLGVVLQLGRRRRLPALDR